MASMQPRLLTLLALCLVTLVGAAPAIAPGPALPGGKTKVVVIPVQEQVDSPLLFIIRRGLKEAIENKADVVVLDMKTPGGALDVTFDIMEALAKFPGQTITYVNDQAISAGAFIAASTEEIWFSPRGKIGAAAPVNATGQEIDKSMRQKVVSYLRAEVRSISEGKGYRGQVISAMIDENYELKIGEEVLKPKGELLTLTASEAAKTYGEPAQPLLAAGIAKDLADLLAQKFGADRYTTTTLEVTWSEELAVFIKSISPILMGLGMLALYIEFKTPGFGMFGMVGIGCLAIVFLGSYVAGLSGHEPMLVFALGAVLVAVEIFVMPGVIVFALGGLLLMLGSLVWSLADLWPNEPVSVAWSGDAFVGPIQQFALGLVIAVALAVALARFLPRGWVWDRLVVQSTVGGAAQLAGGAVDESVGALVGREGVAMTDLRPSGQIEIDGRRHEARSELGPIDRGRPVRVRAQSDFGLVVEEKR
ncbi:MAG: ATP-dependent Clp protease proteolytic subunit [Opitutaceae bacterium]|nr:ATP-dependent Clp protease proteolytic subunit [Opitutaceae bacterium]